MRQERKYFNNSDEPQSLSAQFNSGDRDILRLEIAVSLLQDRPYHLVFAS